MQRTVSSRRRPLASAIVVLAGAGFLAAAAHAGQFAANVISVYALGNTSVVDPTGTLSTGGTGARGDLLLASDGNLYFATAAGGLSGVGAVMRLTPDGTMTVMHSFAGATTEAATVYAGLIQGSDGYLYGTSYLGGLKAQGTVFRVALDGTYANLYSFSSDNKGGYEPYTSLLQGPDGAFYGTTLRGGANNLGTVFRITTDGTLTTLYSFAGSDGSAPEGKLVLGADGALYGTTLTGGPADRGTIYRITTSGTLTVLYSFAALSTTTNAAGVSTNAMGANPRDGLTLGSDGNFYGTAYQGGSAGYGTVFQVTPAGVLTVLHTFAGGPTDGAYPLAGVTRLADGTLYGTTQNGGYNNVGVAWRLGSTGTYDILHAFTSSTVDGTSPYTKLLPLNGYLYGVTYSDATYSAGTVFKLDEGAAGVLPVTFSISPQSLALGASATLAWNSPTAASCVSSGAWTDVIATSGTMVETPSTAGIYTYVLTCTDGGGAVRNAYASLEVTAPPAQTVDGGATTGGGALSLVSLGLLGAAATALGRRRYLSANK